MTTSCFSKLAVGQAESRFLTEKCRWHKRLWHFTTTSIFRHDAAFAGRLRQAQRELPAGPDGYFYVLTDQACGCKLVYAGVQPATA
ncbi:hypothetical protein BL250_08680 [Erwinia sp. OLTSP20]|nr:hypothetical protein BV501_04360 [Erwinia sp. OAMSP11]PIJ74059.1 hypothetical protein BK416_04650 [Erwinia sp. OLSSP12]PIJ81165.1 hypothetical protein BLD47_09495 [Erwinia sp. OLCASP19]PIJ86022.1 hypothetical protein BLD46_04445 [Erwinia sp. OLMTSP26]PIJ87771.1 hypothetical protein BLD49_04445 [Erwinia sp. OLMDSP33]PIJ90802.1 hypothetical protein BL249_10860 [Erwinia sp. OLFS4]PIJ92761.1 hypothetical protein BL250_08680 [Erwinia sp. OLTSP20]